MPNETIRSELYEKWVKNPKESGAARWKALRDATDSVLNDFAATKNSKRKSVNYAELDAWRYELVLTHCYARLDINVSKTQNHLLKSPFCVHPKTGKVCVPIDPHMVDDFDPFSTSYVPTLNSLQHEVSIASDVLNELFNGVWYLSWIVGLARLLLVPLRRKTISRRPP